MDGNMKKNVANKNFRAGEYSSEIFIPTFINITEFHSTCYGDHLYPFYTEFSLLTLKLNNIPLYKFNEFDHFVRLSCDAISDPNPQSFCIANIANFLV